jgi:hypothetical protein
MAKNKPEVWLRGPLADIPALLQPVAHALLQAREELNELMAGFPDSILWNKVAGMASPGFHLQHLTGVLDRLFTYAKGEGLSTEQLVYLTAEDEPHDNLNPPLLVERFNLQVDAAWKQLAETDQAILTNIRGVGRSQIPSTVIGLYVHAAEHTMRHLGQLLVTVRVLKQGL